MRDIALQKDIGAKIKYKKFTDSNCKAATFEGNPDTIQAISHGRRESLEVLTAPPFDSPLCCFNRRAGLGVEPTYREA